jgi:hypothetical protein
LPEFPCLGFAVEAGSLGNFDENLIPILTGKLNFSQRWAQFSGCCLHCFFSFVLCGGDPGCRSLD